SAATSVMAPELMLPAPAQGIVGVETRSADQRMMRYLAAIDDAPASAQARAERALLATLDGSCRTPIAALSTLQGDRLPLHARIGSPDAKARQESRRTGSTKAAEAIGRDAGDELRAAAGPGFFDLPIPEGTPV